MSEDIMIVAKVREKKDPELIKWIKQKAQNEHRTVNGFIISMLKKAMADEINAWKVMVEENEIIKGGKHKGGK